MSSKGELYKVLIVDDSEINRAILADMLGDQYEILEAENGLQAVQILHQCACDISLILLDVVMPEMDGFEVLAMMNRYHWIEEIPVIMISAENSHSVVERAYELGASDYISRPFDEVIVRRRVINTIILYSKQKHLISLVADQMYEREKSNNLMVSILSHIVEFRNGESGLHVLHIGVMTELLLKRLQEKTDRYPLDAARISMISKAAAFHDIGKIAISEEILNKPGRLTPEEFEIMKTHSMIGANMLDALPLYHDDPLVEVAYEICRWHHERYDGRGYPDGLKGDEIPISAQVVSIADVYDALTSERVYKKALPHQTAMDMILNGECGAFHPLLLECLNDISERIQEEMTLHSLGQVSRCEIQNIAKNLFSHKEIATSNRTLNLLEKERIKFQFFASMSSEIQFEYTTVPPMLTLSEWGAARLGLPQNIINPSENRELLQVIPVQDLYRLNQTLLQTTPDNPVVEYESDIMIDGKRHRNRLICRSMWSGTDESEYSGAIGKVIDIHEETQELLRLKKLASLDSLTHLLNQTHARKMIVELLERHPQQDFVMIIFDLDYFKSANRQRGHLFGDRVLKYMAERLKNSIHEQDIAARIGGDEFLVFLPSHPAVDQTIQNIFHSLSGEYDGFDLSVSMGIARTSVVGRNYEVLYHSADRALYDAKLRGHACYSYYKNVSGPENVPTTISKIDK